MVCMIQRPTAQELWDKIQKDFSVTVLGGGTIIPESNEHYLVSLLYAMQQEAYSYGDMLMKEADPRTACCDNLIATGERDGVFLRDATPAQGYIKLHGIPGVNIPQTIEFEIDGEKYSPASTVIPAIPQSGEAIILIEAQKPGEQTNTSQSTTGAVISPPEGIEAKIDIMGGLCGGENKENCEQFRSRYLNRLQFKPQSILSWIKEKVLEWPCVTDVCESQGTCYETDEKGNPVCPDRLQLYVLFRNTFPCGIAPDCVVDDMNEWLFGTPQGFGKGQLPFGICGNIRYVRPVYINIRIDGLGCATSAQQLEIDSRIRDYIAAICPSQNLLSQEIEMIVAQVLGAASSFSVVVEAHLEGDDNCTDEKLHIDNCGNVSPDCDYKICLNDLTFVNLQKTGGNCY